MFYDNFVKLCNNVNMAPSAVAAELGLSRASVNGWKNGKIPTDANQLRIAEYFNVTVDYLLGNDTKKEPAQMDELTYDDFTYALYNESKELTEDNKNKLLEMAKFFKQQQDKSI